jgi:two-component system OmpR family response regulator
MTYARSATSRVLVVEDEPAINDIVATALRYQGHQVTQVDDGGIGLHEVRTSFYDLVVLDVMLPGVDGLEICRRMRNEGIHTPVLFLTARSETEDRVRGFATGGDDYLTKPFSVDELVLRVAAILRRSGSRVPAGLLAYDDLTVDPASTEVRRAGRLIDLSPTEFRLLSYLIENSGTVLSKAKILDEVWGVDFEGSDNVVELYIGYLRRKLDDGRSPLIQTRRGMGYVLRRVE